MSFLGKKHIRFLLPAFDTRIVPIRGRQWCIFNSNKEHKNSLQKLATKNTIQTLKGTGWYWLIVTLILADIGAHSYHSLVSSWMWGLHCLLHFVHFLSYHFFKRASFIYYYCWLLSGLRSYNNTSKTVYKIIKFENHFYLILSFL